MVNNKAISNSKKRVQKILGVFTQTLEQLGKEKDQLNSVIDNNLDFIKQAQIENEEAVLEIGKIESVMNNISKIVNG